MTTKRPGTLNQSTAAYQITPPAAHKTDSRVNVPYLSAVFLIPCNRSHTQLSLVIVKLPHVPHIPIPMTPPQQSSLLLREHALRPDHRIRLSSASPPPPAYALCVVIVETVDCPAEARVSRARNKLVSPERGIGAGSG